jgi:hypothetical protein
MRAGLPLSPVFADAFIRLIVPQLAFRKVSAKCIISLYIAELQVRYDARLTRTFSERRLRDVE